MAQQATATFRGPGGQDPVAAVHNITLALVPTQGDMLLAGQIWRSRIVQRTQNGVDVNGAPFAAYSANGPYYFYPGTEGHGMSRSQAHGLYKFASFESSSLDRKLSEYYRLRGVAAEGRHGKSGKVGKRTALGIRYDSYGAAHAALGRSNVDLFGLEHHPHMMGAMLVKAGGTELDMSATLDLDPSSNTSPCSQMNLGFYGEQEARARGHNEGAGHLPQRRFFDASAEDLHVMKETMLARAVARAEGVGK